MSVRYLTEANTTTFQDGNWGGIKEQSWIFEDQAKFPLEDKQRLQI
jgi:hypothetical protein